MGWLRRGQASALVLILIGISAAGPVAAFGGTRPPAELWVSRFDGPIGNEGARAEAVSPDGSEVFVTGYSEGVLYADDYATVAYNSATGAEEWVARYHSTLGHNDVSALGVSPDGSRVYVTGESQGSGGGTSYATLAYDSATGTQEWLARYNGPGKGSDSATALAVSPDGSRVFVTGYSQRFDTGYDYATVAYGAGTGAQEWVALYDGVAGGRADYATALGLSPDGSRVFVTGQSQGSSGADYATVSYDSATGVRGWLTRYDGPGEGADSPVALGVSPDGSRVFVTGKSHGSAGGADYATVSYDSVTGIQAWSKRYNGSAKRGDFAADLAVSADGSQVFVTGSTEVIALETRDPATDYATVAYDSATGVREWVRCYDGPAHTEDIAHALAVSPDASLVFVTGQSNGTTHGQGYGPDEDFATAAYAAATGAEQWVKRYVGPYGRDWAFDVAVSRDGTRMFVTGLSQSEVYDSDYGTVAYTLR